jgi:hypothetical protein
MANVSKLMLGAAIAAVSIASPALAAHKGIRTDMSHKAIKEAVLVLLPQYRARLTIRRSPVAVALAIIKTSASISGDLDRAGGPGPSHAPAPKMAGATKSFATAIDIRDMTEVECRAMRHSWPEAFDLRCEKRGSLMSCVTAPTALPLSR